MSEEYKNKTFEMLDEMLPRMIDEIKNGEDFKNMVDELKKLKGSDSSEQNESVKILNAMNMMMNNGGINKFMDIAIKLEGLDNVTKNEK